MTYLRIVLISIFAALIALLFLHRCDEDRYGGSRGGHDDPRPVNPIGPEEPGWLEEPTDTLAPVNGPEIPEGGDVVEEEQPCGAGSIESKHGNYHQRTYDMGRQSGRTRINTDFKGFIDTLYLYDGPEVDPNFLIIRKAIPQFDNIEFSFTRGSVTVVVKSTDNSDWEYLMDCPE